MTALSTRAALAEALSWTSGEMTRYSDTAHPDHNRWSWRGDGHGDKARQDFLDQADALIASGAVVDVDTLADDKALGSAVRAAIRAESLDRFSSEYLTADARDWLAGFAARAAIRALAATLTERAS